MIDQIVALLYTIPYFSVAFACCRTLIAASSPKKEKINLQPALKVLYFLPHHTKI